MIDPRQAQIDQFNRDGFLIVDRMIDPAEADRVAARYEPKIGRASCRERVYVLV